MKTNELALSEVGVLAPVYNEVHADVPFCPPVDEEEFARGFPYRAHSRPGYEEALLVETVFVAREGGRVVGFADVGVARVVRDGAEERRGLLRAFAFPVGRRRAGEALLAAALDFARDAGAGLVGAFRNCAIYDHGGYRFQHLDFGMLPDRLVHIGALLLRHGFEPSGGEVFLLAPDFPEPAPLPTPEGVRIVVESAGPERAARPGFYVRAYRAEREIGVFECCSAAEFSGNPDLDDTGLVEGLYIVSEEQGLRLGLVLHTRGLIEMRRAGYRHAAISTDWRNARALLFYANHGYRLADTVHEFRRAD